jgi:hypothetical protein
MAGLCKTRRVGVLAACAASIGAGIVLLWVLLPHAISRVGTVELMALLGLFALPMAATLSLVMERQSRRGRHTAGAGTALPDDPPAQGPAETEAAPDSDASTPVWSAVSREREPAGAGGGIGRGGLLTATRR